MSAGEERTKLEKLLHENSEKVAELEAAEQEIRVKTENAKELEAESLKFDSQLAEFNNKKQEIGKIKSELEKDEQDIGKTRAELEVQKSELDNIKSRMKAEELELKCLSIEDVRRTYEKESNEIEQEIKKIEALKLLKEKERNELDNIFTEHEKLKNKLESDILEVKRKKTEVDKLKQDVSSQARALKLRQEELKEMSENAKNVKGELINIHRLQVTITNLNKELEKREAYIATLEKEAVDLKDKLKSKNKQTRQIDIQTKLLHDNIKLQDINKSVI